MISFNILLNNEQVIQIADDASKDFREIIKNGRTVRVLDGDAIARAKLRVEVRLKHLKVYNPQVWGEQSTLITKSVDGTDDMTAEELEKRIAELDEKNGIVKEGCSAAAA